MKTVIVGGVAAGASTGARLRRLPIEHDRPENRANDIKVDDRGRAWVGTMAFDKRATASEAPSFAAAGAGSSDAHLPMRLRA